MYVPAHFDKPSREVLYELIENSALGMLITHGRSGLDANHIPFELDTSQGENGTLYSCAISTRAEGSAHSRSSDVFKGCDRVLAHSQADMRQPVTHHMVSNQETLRPTLSPGAHVLQRPCS
ncbi:FMN-binding negative transcriptional regulator [Mesorhizobium sp. M1340]|uniref:FMN-binding negative transcriptional regulator n=1 Tax=Mesorhizobium sp. M1340 TaxID=2957087 RepID=UPI003337C6FB